MTLIKSMTGYGRAVKTLLGREFTVELRAVNNRYLDCTVKLPRSLTFAEEGVKQRVKAAVARGKVDVLISVGAAAGEPVQVSLNRPVLEGYLQAMNAMVQEYGVHNDISAAALARLPEVFLVEKPKEDEDELLSALLQVVDEALAAFNAMRAAEGAAMEADLQSRGQTILNLVAQVEAGSPQTVADYLTRFFGYEGELPALGTEQFPMKSGGYYPECGAFTTSEDVYTLSSLELLEDGTYRALLQAKPYGMTLELTLSPTDDGLLLHSALKTYGS